MARRALQDLDAWLGLRAAAEQHASVVVSAALAASAPM